MPGRGRRARPILVRAPLAPTQAIALGSIATAESVPGPGVTQTQSVFLGAIGTGTGLVTGPSIAQTGVAPAPDFEPRVKAALYDRDGTLKADLADAAEHKFQKVHSDTGNGGLVLQNDDADLALVDFTDVVQYSIDEAAVFATLVESTSRASIAAGEEADQRTTVSGRDRLAMLEEAIVEAKPFGLGTSRLWNYASPDLEDAGWPYAVQTYQGRAGSGTARNGVPHAWPDPGAWWIWDRYAPIGLTDSVPTGDVYLRRRFTVVAAGAYSLFSACDDLADIWLDGVQLVSRVGAGNANKTDIFLEVGEHVIAVKGSNGPNPLPNPAGVLVSIMHVGSSGAIGASIFQSDQSWRAVGYPANPPGFTPGRVLRLLIEEAQDRGALDGFLTTFSDLSDSAGNPWPYTPDIATPVGGNLLTVVRQLCESYMSVRMHVGSFTMDAYSTYAPASGVTLAAGVNLTELTHEASV